MIIDMQELIETLAGDPKREYAIADVKRMGLIPWARNYRTLQKIVVQDFFGENVLEARIEGEGRQVRYLMKGANIIKFIKRYGPMARKSKRTWIKQKRS